MIENNSIPLCDNPIVKKVIEILKGKLLNVEVCEEKKEEEDDLVELGSTRFVFAIREKGEENKWSKFQLICPISADRFGENSVEKFSCFLKKSSF